MQIFSFFNLCAMPFSAASAPFFRLQKASAGGISAKSNPPKAGNRLAGDRFHSYGIGQNQANGCAVTSLLILAIRPWSTAPGPHSMKVVAPAAIMFWTDFVQRTGEVS